ncbi:hypothetical protein Hypma_002739 [Hypsizygus marmoreus]|uniref:Uncharacterized protein n=1 Tax=Hypsizygus marmoreus TaxID=39966 RepID=A0A369J6Y8_HYPMA|nr:hypothetical protein Hypma_002739 [Hypsizygus marmoreus]
METQLEACMIQIFIEPDTRGDRWIFQKITVKVGNPDVGDVGKLSAVRILRQFCMHDFHIIADDHSQPIQMLASGVFDQHGHIQHKLLAGTRKGTGCWGVELNYGALIHIEEVFVEQQFTGMGIRSVMVNALLASSYITPVDHLTCWPTEESQVAFYHKNDFRRIGHTALFGYSQNPSHPSRLLVASADVDAEDGAEPAAAFPWDYKTTFPPLHPLFKGCFCQGMVCEDARLCGPGQPLNK